MVLCGVKHFYGQTYARERIPAPFVYRKTFIFVTNCLMGCGADEATPHIIYTPYKKQKTH